MANRIQQLLVSVRNAAEARSAVEGGCDILDVKEPNRGSLGFADVAQVEAVLEMARSSVIPLPVSAALGEAAEWLTAMSPSNLPGGLAFIKLGTAGLASFSDWAGVWKGAVSRFSRQAASCGEVSEISPGLVAVAYADWQLAAAPSPITVIEAAPSLGCSGVLIDTHHKNGQSLLDWTPMAELESLVLRARNHGLTLALAGSLKLADVRLLVELCPDIIGVRSAACRDGLRRAPIDTAAVCTLKELFGSSTFVQIAGG